MLQRYQQYARQNNGQSFLKKLPHNFNSFFLLFFDIMRNRSVPYPQVHSTAIKLFAARPLFMAAQPFQQAKLLRMQKRQ